MSFGPLTDGLGFEPVNHRHPHFDRMTLVEGHHRYKKRLACCTTTPFTTTTFTTPLDIIKLNDAADGVIPSSLAAACA